MKQHENPGDSETSTPQISPSTSFAENLNETNKYRKLELQMQMRSMNAQINQNSKRSMRQKLNVLCDENQLPMDSNVIEYWKKLKRSDKDLWNLLQVVLAVPSTQVSVERSFSALSTVLTKLRTKLSKRNLSNILLTKLNFDLLEDSHLESIDIDTVVQPKEKENNRNTEEKVLNTKFEDTDCPITVQQEKTSCSNAKVVELEKPLYRSRNKKEYRNKILKVDILREIRKERQEYYKARLQMEERKLEAKKKKMKILKERNNLLRQCIQKGMNLTKEEF
ncbi:hypothetical protein ABEB36_014549 [Hypothenemus hampei]|uniref:HAT C-terminal dimerisation domain-containing protein n=1 Tax=Hypothenemus hampei TaxID=57062 RepID=A0ABD1E2E1_HYPHA